LTRRFVDGFASSMNQTSGKIFCTNEVNDPLASHRRTHFPLHLHAASKRGTFTRGEQRRAFLRPTP
jgi:hypothetical protein